jgi:hypothetical protein
MSLACTIRCRVDWDLFDGIREFCGVLCGLTDPSPGTGDRVRVAVQEAMETIAAYVDTQRQICVRIDHSAHDITISVTGTESDAGSLERLSRDVEIVSSRPPVEAFVESLSRADDDPDRVRILGLARMRYEAAFELAVDNDSGALRLNARTTP